MKKNTLQARPSVGRGSSTRAALTASGGGDARSGAGDDAGVDGGDGDGRSGDVGGAGDDDGASGVAGEPTHLAIRRQD